MRITYSEFKKKRVETQSGIVLGEVRDLVLDVESFELVQLKVKGSALKRKEYLIHIAQIKRVEEKRIVVSDAAISKEKSDAESVLPGAAESVALRGE